MKLSLAVLAVGLTAASVSRADLLPPGKRKIPNELPAGTKNIPIEHRIETDKDHADWEFFVVRGKGGVERMKLAPKAPLVIPGSSAVGDGPPPRPGEKERAIPYRSSALFAVPKDAAKGFKTEKELHAAIEGGQVRGMVRVKDVFYDHLTVTATDPRKSITRWYQLGKIDGKDGLVVKPVKQDDEPKKKEDALAVAPRGGLWVAGLIASLGILLAGLWLVTRCRSHRAA
jgi:hypothetical protein